MKCAADKKTAAVCSAIALTHEVISHAWICQIEEWWILSMAVMRNKRKPRGCNIITLEQAQLRNREELELLVDPEDWNRVGQDMQMEQASAVRLVAVQTFPSLVS